MCGLTSLLAGAGAYPGILLVVSVCDCYVLVVHGGHQKAEKCAKESQYMADDPVHATAIRLQHTAGPPCMCQGARMSMAKQLRGHVAVIHATAFVFKVKEENM